MSDSEAVALATAELARSGLSIPIRSSTGSRSTSQGLSDVRPGYREAVAEIRGYLEHFANLRTCGRNGLHRYNNQDHSMWTAVARRPNLATGSTHDVWSVNTKGEYLERAGEMEGELEDLELVL